MEIYIQSGVVLVLIGIAIGSIATFVGLVLLGDRLERKDQERKQRIWKTIEEQVKIVE